MRKYLLFICCMLFAASVSAQQLGGKRPAWVDESRQLDLSKSYVNVFRAKGSSYENARKKAVEEIANERSRATGRRYIISESNGNITINSSDNLTVKARIVDEYVEQEDNSFTISLLVQTASNPAFAFDPVKVTNKYPVTARVLVPGMAQLHKGSITKGIVFIAAEVAAVGGLVACEGMRSSYQSKVGTTHNAKDRQNYIDKANNAQNVRNAFIAGAVAVYLWNVVDGIVAKGRRHLETGNIAMHIAPYATPYSAGLAMNINF